MAKGGLAKQRFRERQLVNRLNAEFTSLRNANPNATAEQIFNMQRNGQQAQAGTTPAEEQPNPYANATTAPAWAQQSMTGPAAPTAGAFQNAIAAMQQPGEWWKNVSADQLAMRGRDFGTTGPGAPKVLPRPAKTQASPFSGVTGSVGTGTNQETQTAAYGGSYNPSAPRPATPYVPQWLAGRPPAYGGSYNPTIPQANTLTGTTQPSTNTGAGSTTGGRTPNPNTGMPDFPMLADLETGPSGGGGYSTWKKWKRRGGGGKGRGRFYSPQGYEQQEREPFVPSAGLANWSIG